MMHTDCEVENKVFKSTVIAKGPLALEVFKKKKKSKSRENGCVCVWIVTHRTDVNEQIGIRHIGHANEAGLDDFLTLNSGHRGSRGQQQGWRA